MGKATESLIHVDLRIQASLVSEHQYLKSREAQDGIRHHITRLLKQGILRKCRVAWNNSLLPVKKPGNQDYHQVQDLKEVNGRVAYVHPTVSNPYTLLYSFTHSRTCYTVLDLKGAFFFLTLTP